MSCKYYLLINGNIAGYNNQSLLCGLDYKYQSLLVKHTYTWETIKLPTYERLVATAKPRIYWLTNNIYMTRILPLVKYSL